jgi:hypothetical protein
VTALAVALSAVMLLLCIANAWAEHRRGWLVAMPIIAAGVTGGLEGFMQMGVASTLPTSLLPSFILAV